jgi:hypothetical protein
LGAEKVRSKSATESLGSLPRSSESGPAAKRRRSLGDRPVPPRRRDREGENPPPASSRWTRRPRCSTPPAVGDRLRIVVLGPSPPSWRSRALLLRRPEQLQGPPTGPDRPRPRGRPWAPGQRRPRQITGWGAFWISSVGAELVRTEGKWVAERQEGDLVEITACLNALFNHPLRVGPGK